MFPAVSATFTPNKTVVCSGSSIIFTAVTGASKYFWDYGDGSNGYATNAATHMFTNTTTAPMVMHVNLKTTSFYNCENTSTVDITVNAGTNTSVYSIAAYTGI